MHDDRTRGSHKARSVIAALLAALLALSLSITLRHDAFAVTEHVVSSLKNPGASVSGFSVDWYFTKQLKKVTPTWTADTSKIYVSNNPSGAHSLCVKGVPSGRKTYTASGSPLATVRYSDVIITTQQKRCDFVLEITAVTLAVETSHARGYDFTLNPPEETYYNGNYPFYHMEGVHFLAKGAVEQAHTPRTGVEVKYNIKVVYKGTNTPASGNGYMRYTDLDQPDKIYYSVSKPQTWVDWNDSGQDNCYTEGLEMISGVSDVYWLADTEIVKFKHNGHDAYRGTQQCTNGRGAIDTLCSATSSYAWRCATGETFLYTDPVYPGYLAMKKTSSNTSTMGSGNSGDYDLSGAKFQVKCKSSSFVKEGLVMGEFVSDSSGNCSVANSEFDVSPDNSRLVLMPGTYTITETAAPAKGYKSKVGEVVATVTVTSGGTVTATVSNEPMASVNVGKKSTLPWSEGLSQYDLSGAVYGVYEDAGCTTQVSSITTGSGGSSGNLSLDEGTYYVKEITPSKGYGLNTSVMSVTLGAGTSKSLDLTEPPKEDPIEIDKHDADLGFMTGWKTTPQGSASLVGAEYTVCYYDGLYSTLDELPSPTRTWVMKTSANGVCKFIASNKVSGDAFYTNSSGQPTIPLGSITITETKAPPGYTAKDQFLEDPKTYLSQVVPLDTNSTAVKFVAQNYTGANVDSNGKIDTYNVVKRGDADMTKGDWDIREMINRYKEGYKENLGLPENTPEGNAVLNGAVFAIYNSNPNPVLSPVNKALIMPGGEVCRIKTDVDGYTATTRDDLNGWRRPGTWMGALAYGTYTLREISPPYGYHHNDDWVGTVTVNEDKEMFAVKEVVKGTPDRLYYH